MDLYKLVIMALLLNFGIMAGTMLAQPDSAWSQFQQSSSIIGFVATGTTMGAGLSNPVTLAVQQGSTTIEDKAGLSTFILGMTVITIIALVAGSMIAVGGTIIGATVYEQEPVMQIILFACLMFVILIYFMLGMKVFTWWKNRDTR